METYKITTQGTYIAHYVVEASSLEEAIEKFKNGDDEIFEPEYQDDQVIQKIEVKDG